MAVQSELDLSRERKQVDDLTAAFERLQLGAAKTNRTNLSSLEAQVDALAAGASGSLKRMLIGMKGNLQELDGMLTATGRKVSVAWATVAADTFARVNADMSRVKQAFITKFDEASRAAVSAAAKMSADIQTAEQKALSAGSSGVGQGLKALARTRAEGYTDAFGTFITASSMKMAAEIQAAERRMLSAGSSGVANSLATRQRVAGTTDALGMFVPATPTTPGIVDRVSNSIRPADIKNAYDLSSAFKKLTIDGNDVHSAMRGLASGFNLLWLTWGNLAPLFAGASLSFGVTKTFEIGSEVEQNIKMLEVLGDKTKEQGSVIREELRKIDQTTLFSLKELSKTMVELEQAGISGAEGLRLLKVSADLAAVGNTNLDVTSKLLTQTMGVFPETAADIEKAAAQMFKTTKDGKLNIDNIGDSIRYASTANLMYGQSLEDTLVALKALASVGITDSMAGTGFANLLQDLTGRTGPAKKALAEMEKALGRTIKAFDIEGKARPFLDVVKDIQEALGKFKPAAAMELANKAFTERGLRPLFAAIAQGTVDLKDYKKELQNIDPSMLGKAATSIMDPTKGAMDRLRGEIVGLLDRTFESMDSRFKDSINRLTGLLGSSEFSEIMRGMVSGVVTLGEAAVQYLPTILKLGTAFLAFQALGFVKPLLLEVAVGLASLIGFLNLSSTQMGRMAGSAVAGATSVGALGTSMIVTAASSRAAAAGLGLVQIEAAGAAAKLTVAAGAGRAAALILGFLANPIVGVITTLGLLAYTFSSVSKSSQSASEELSAKLYKDGKVNIDILNQEIAKINERNVVAANDRGKSTVFDGATEKALAAYKKSTDKLQNFEARVASSGARRLTEEDRENQQRRLDSAKAEQKIAYDNWHSLHFARQKVLDNSEKLEAAAEAKRMKGVRAAQTKAEADAQRATSGLDLSGASKTSKGVREHTTALKLVKDNLESIASSGQAAVAQLTDTYNTERDLLSNLHSNMLIDEGTYQAQSIAQLQSYEAEKLRLLDAKDEAGRAEAYRAYVANADILQKQLDQAKGTADEQLAYRTEKEKEFSETVNRVGEKLRSDLANSDTERVKLHNEAYKRMTVAAQNYAGAVKKLDLKTDEEILAIRLRREEAEATSELSRQYAGVTSNSMAYLQAQKASAFASANARAEAQKHLETMDKAIRLAEQAVESFREFASGTGMLLMPEGMAAYSAQLQEIEALRRNRTKYAGEATTDIAAAGKRAFQNIIEEDIQRLKTSTADAIMTGLFEGGKAGKASLRKLIVEELKRPIRFVVDAVVNTIFGSVSGGAGFSGFGSGGYGSIMNNGLGESFGLSENMFAGFPELGTNYQLTELGTDVASLADSAVSFVGYANAFNTAFSRNAQGGKDYGKAAGQALGTYLGGPIGSMIGGEIGAALGLVDYGGTYHTGGLASYSAAGGTKTGAAALAGGMSFGLEAKDYNAAGEKAAAGFAKGIVGVLDSTATVFGKKTGYEVSTAFADDISPDGAWGALFIRLGESTLVDWEDGQDKWPGREFADGDAGLKEYQAAVAKNVRDYLVTQVPDWADAALNALGDSVTIEQLAATVAQINAAASALGIMGKASAAFAGLSEQATSALITAMGGAETAGANLSGYYANFYTEAERTKLATQALTTEMAAFGKVMPATRAEFKGLVDAAIAAGDTSLAANLLNVADKFAAVVPAADDASNSLGKATRTLQEIADESLNLEKEWLRVTGNTSALRELEIQEIDSSNQAMQRQIWAYEDQQAAAEAAQEANKAAQEAHQKYMDSLAEANEFLAGFTRDIRSYLDKLNADVQGSQGYNSAAAAFGAQMSLARGGDRDALSGITNYASTLMDAIQRESRTAEEAALRSGRVRGQLAALPGQISAEQLIVNAVNAGALSVGNSVFAVGGAQVEAINALGAGYVTALQPVVAELGTGFSKLDANLSNTLDFTEFSAGMLGKATDAEIQRLFNLIDVDNDQLISAAEATRAASLTFGQQVQVGLSADFARLDTSLNNSLDSDEFSAGLVGLATDESITNLFNLIDTDNDKLISAAEATAAAALTFGQQVQAGLAADFDSLDTTLNNALDFSEFSAAFSGLASDAVLREVFAGLDTNADGQISRLEAIAANTGSTAVDTSNGVVPTLRDINTSLGYHFGNLWSGLHTDLAVISGQLASGIRVTSVDQGGNRVAFAQGGAFTNGIVSRPTTFNMGLMGEAGPEAILPLTLTSGGDLGVKSLVPASMVQTFDNGNDEELIAELKALRESNEGLRSDNRAQALALVQVNRRMVKIFERWDNNGIPEERVVA